jgi:uncharacterized protein (TIGR02118 family)
MTILYVSYHGDARTRFDRDYYVATHIPLVMEAWTRHGLENCAAFFPASNGAGTIAIAECRFRDEACLQAAFASPETARVMADISNFTDVEPSRRRAELFCS